MPSASFTNRMIRGSEWDAFWTREPPNVVILKDGSFDAGERFIVGNEINPIDTKDSSELRLLEPFQAFDKSKVS